MSGTGVGRAGWGGARRGRVGWGRVMPVGESEVGSGGQGGRGVG